ncbi:MAG: hypothetical protein AB7D07_15945 [Desulfovibrionaceae bacterium]
MAQAPLRNCCESGKRPDRPGSDIEKHLSNAIGKVAVVADFLEMLDISGRQGFSPMDESALELSNLAIKALQDLRRLWNIHFPDEPVDIISGCKTRLGVSHA